MLRRRILQLICSAVFVHVSTAQSDTTSSTDSLTPTTTTTSTTDSAVTATPSLGDSTCTFLTGNSCKLGTCNFCARCVQQSCILANNTGLVGSARNTCSGRSRQTWYDYCVSTASDANGVSCTDNYQCYPYHNNTPSAWPNLACDPNLCFMISANGSPTPTPSIIPNITATTISDPDAQPTTSSSSPYSGDGLITPNSSKPSVTTIALIAVSSLLFLLGLAWLTRIITKCRLCPTPFFERRDDQPIANADSAPHQPDNQSTTSSTMTEPLPVYVPPDAPPPKYENAIVNQIREDRAWPASPTSPTSWYYGMEQGLEQGVPSEASSSEMQQVTAPAASRGLHPFFSWRS